MQYASVEALLPPSEGAKLDSDWPDNAPDKYRADPFPCDITRYREGYIASHRIEVISHRMRYRINVPMTLSWRLSKTSNQIQGMICVLTNAQELGYPDERLEL